ncbi:NRDE family protein [Actinomadura sp. DC4]|uniref:NRDE family protein n=1 Tax=Actinomadura sp. DC4 TaxID=3055069 RepID=UPI0025B1C05B|nr:NRDE family protein [Actinomadura sp. DC4]MDN3355262.1 NRDE family protein [Actinomadura sp. DC4]
MCTAIVGYDPGARVPLVLAGVRDEMTARAWRPPARHWPDHPGLIGGIDELAGGTWLALDPAAPRVACVLNGRGREAPASLRRSRGSLPLTLAATGALDGDLEGFDPFHLIGADPSGVSVRSWDGERLVVHKLEPGLHFVVNSGLAEAGTEGGDDFMSARVAHFRPLFESAARDRPAWLHLLDGDGLDVSDDRALIVRRDLGEGRIWGTTSVSLVTFGPDGVRYDFSAAPGDPASWRTVPLT